MTTIYLSTTPNYYDNLQKHNARGLRFLVSFWYWRETDLGELGVSDFWADSGAFSAWSSGGVKLDVAEYADWLHRWKHLFDHYANLDVKGDVDAGLRNQAELERRGLRPVPVFHGGEPWSVLQDMIADYPYIALGGMSGNVSNGSGVRVRFVNRCFELAGSKTVYHGFGATSLALLSTFPWHTVDSTTYLNGAKYGTLTVFDPRRGVFEHVPRKPGKHIGLVRMYLPHYRPEVYYDAVLVSSYSFMAYARWLTKLRGESVIPARGKWAADALA